MKRDWGSRRRTRLLRVAVLVFAVLGVSSCGGTTPPPAPGQGRSLAPDLRGLRVLVLPFQLRSGVAGDPDAELAFTLKIRGGEVEWIFEAEVAEALDRSPGIQARTRGLPVGLFLQAEVEHVGDPLFGSLRRMAALVDAEVVLLPVMASFQVNELVVGGTPRVRLTVVLIVPRTGRVVWFGIEEGGDFSLQDPRGLASAAEELVRTLLWYVRDSYPTDRNAR